ANLLRVAAAPIVVGEMNIARDVVADGNAILAYTLLGCRAPARQPQLDEIARRIILPPSAEASRRTAEYLLLGSVIMATLPLDSAWVVRLAPTGGRLLAAQAEEVLGKR